MLLSIDDGLNGFAIFVDQRGNGVPLLDTITDNRRSNLGVLQQSLQSYEPTSAIKTRIPFGSLKKAFPGLLIGHPVINEPLNHIAEQSLTPIASVHRILKDVQRAITSSVASKKDRYPLRGTPFFYIDPLDPVADDDWEALR